MRGHVFPSSTSRVHVSQDRRSTTDSRHRRRSNLRNTGANQASIAPLVITAIIFWLLKPERINRRGEISSVVTETGSRRRKAVEAFTPRELEPTTAELKKLPRHGDKDRRRRICESLRLPEKRKRLLKSSPRHPSRSRVVTPRPKPASG
ncbi:hypothetical protein YC2023_046700 [Brassica napus]